MGNNSSSNPEYARSLEVFSDHEKEQMKSLYEKLCHGGKSLSKDQLQILTEPYIPKKLSDNVFTYMLRKDVDDDVVTNQGFVITLCHGLKGSLEDKTALFHCMVCGDINKLATIQEISQTVTSLFNGYRTHIELFPEFSTWGFKHSELLDTSGLLTKVLMHNLISNDGKLQSEIEDSEPSMTFSREQIETWLGRSALMHTIFDTVVKLCFPIHFAAEVGTLKLINFPVCKNVDWKSFNSLLDVPSLVYLNSRIPHDLRQEWTLLYGSKTHGESFSTMYGRIMKQGPTVMIIKDTKGHVFGGFASQSWAPNAKYFGSENCFLFNLRPHIQAYYSSGLNDHFLYFNHSQETLPNGLGMGGQFDFFGLWLDQEFGQGQSKAQPKCTTYNSPQLSADPDFTVHSIEVWRVGPDPKAQRGAEGDQVKGSILDKDPGAKAMLSLIDKGPHSEGLREMDATADIPEQHHLHPTMDTS